MPAEFPQIPYHGPANARYGNYSKRYLVVHCTSNNASPYNECAYARSRTDGVGLHFASDPSVVLQGLESWYGTGHVGSAVGNQYGIAWEFTGYLSSSRSYYNACIDRAAPAMRQVMAKWGIPHRWLTAAQMNDGKSKGIVTHKMCSDVWGYSDHTDPGPNFDGQYLIDALNGVHDVADISGSETPHAWTQAVRVSSLFNDADQHTVDWGGGPTVEQNVTKQRSVRIEQKLDQLLTKVDVLLSKVELSEEDLQRIEDAAREGAEEGAGGATPDEVRQVVDEELDEAFQGARDTDA